MNYMLFSALCSVLFVRVLSCPLALNVYLPHAHLVGVGVDSPVVLRVGTHPEIRHAIAQSLSRDGNVEFESINSPKPRKEMQMET